MAKAPTSTSTKRFRIALSFAGERREFVAQVAELLAARFTREQILYDEYHEAEFAQHRLGIDLPILYHTQADLNVVVLCPRYKKKGWTGLEWDALHALFMGRSGSKRVMLTRFEQATVKGLFPNAGYIELDDKTPGQAAHLILERLAINEKRERDYYTKTTTVVVAATSPVPAFRHDLPAVQRFFGREQELARLLADLAAVGWGTLIEGPGGMGKTSLAIRAAELAAPGRFDEVLFLSAKQSTQDPHGRVDESSFALGGFTAMLDAIARRLDRPEITQAADDQRCRLVCEMLYDKRVLLVLDNLEALGGPGTPDQRALATFLHHLPRGCKALLTSRTPLNLGGRCLPLTTLTPEAALQTLADIAEGNPALAAESEAERLRLFNATGGNTLLMTWTAWQVGSGDRTTIADALAHLRTCPPGNDALEFIFGDLLAAFSDEELRVVATLSYPAEPIPVEAIAEISEVPEAAALKALKHLTNLSVVVPQEGTPRFALVPMVDVFVRHARPQVVEQVGVSLAARAYRLIKENGWQNHARFPALAAAWPGIAPALPLFLAGANARLQTVCDALSAFLNFQGRWDERLALSEKAEAVALAAADHDKAGWRAYHTGMIHFLRGQAEAVLACAGRAAAHWVQAQAGARERAIAIRLRGLGHQLQGDYPAAIAAFSEALELHRSLDAESVDVAIGLNDLASAEQRSGDLPAAQEHYREALRVARALGDAEGVASYTGNLASLALDRRDWPAAEALAREALSLAEAIHRQELIASNNHGLAKALVRQGKAAEALPHARRAVEIATRLAHPELALSQALLAECEAEAGL